MAHTGNIGLHGKWALAPTFSIGDAVIMDNLPAHNLVGIRAAIEAVGIGRRRPPPYSPDCNLIGTSQSGLCHPGAQLISLYDDRAQVRLGSH